MTPLSPAFAATLEPVSTHPTPFKCRICSHCGKRRWVRDLKVLDRSWTAPKFYCVWCVGERKRRR